MAKRASGKKASAEDEGLLGGPAPAPTAPKSRTTRGADRPSGETPASTGDEPRLPSDVVPTVTRFDQIVGQDAAIHVLQNALKSGRLHHAWIFAGPQGVGKFSAAVALGAALLDPTSKPDKASGRIQPDPESPTQQRIARALRASRSSGGTGILDSGHADLHLITKELAAVSSETEIRKSKQTSIPIDVVREFVIEPAARTRVEIADSLAAKVFIIDEAEMLNPAGQNAILKSLEEPPKGTVFILVTSSEERLLATIRSRCQRVRFEAIDEMAMKQWLARSGLSIEPGKAAWLLRFAMGSPGLALAALDNDLFTWQEALEPLLASVDRGVFVPELGGVLSKLVDERASAVVEHSAAASKDAANKAWARRMLAFLGERTRLRLRARVSQLGPAAGPGDSVIDRCLHVLEVIQDCERHIAGNVNQGLAMENLSAQMIAEPVPTY